MRLESKYLSKRTVYVIGIVILLIIIVKVYQLLNAVQEADFYVYQTIPSGSVTWALIKNLPVDNTIESGFACKCDRTSGTKKWKGINDNGCKNGPGANTDKAVRLDHLAIPGVQPSKPKPDGACCQWVPTVRGLYVRNLFNCS